MRLIRMVEGLLPYRRPIIVFVHAGEIALAYWLAFQMRFDFDVPQTEYRNFWKTLPLLLGVRLVVFGFFHLYKGLWRYISMTDLLSIGKAVALSSLLFVAATLAIFGHGFPRVVFALDLVLCLAIVAGVRLGIRAIWESSARADDAPGLRALVVGAGDAGELLIREIQRSLHLNYDLAGLVDDDPRKLGRRIHGVEVLGSIEQLPDLCSQHKVEEILIAIPSANAGQRQRLAERCRVSGVSLKTVPRLSDLIVGKAFIGQLQEVTPEDLLGREAVRLDLDRLRGELEGRRVLVTGAAGSIGSELCRQIAPFRPEMLLMLDRAESGLFLLQQELRRTHPELAAMPVIGDLADSERIGEVVRTYRPDVLYHAAAYKHVPLMEEHPLQAIENNVFGTETVARAALMEGVRKFVLISTDKAVRPVGVMGMTKRVAEDLVNSLAGGTTFVTVRFGNVLGSEGSVLPLFRQQIAHGGPITLTDPEATRYFMLLSEAAQLVLQAGSMGRGGEVFFLDMGEPVKIVDLAESLIRLSGLTPGRDVDMQVVGLRPGERLREELVMEQEEMVRSDHEKILIVQNHRFDAGLFRKDLEVLQHFVQERRRDEALEQLRSMATRY